MSETSNFDRTRAALAEFDATAAEREQAWADVKTNADVHAASDAEKAALAKVHDAFYADTADYNSRESIGHVGTNFIRHTAGLPFKVSIGGVSFGRLIGEIEPGGNPKWAHFSVIGDERVALLRKVRNNEPLPEGLILIGQASGSLYVPITRDYVAWETSGI